jgi:hypothetical protein
MQALRSNFQGFTLEDQDDEEFSSNKDELGDDDAEDVKEITDDSYVKVEYETKDVKEFEIGNHRYQNQLDFEDQLDNQNVESNPKESQDDQELQVEEGEPTTTYHHRDQSKQMVYLDILCLYIVYFNS